MTEPSALLPGEGAGAPKPVDPGGGAVGAERCPPKHGLERQGKAGHFNEHERVWHRMSYAGGAGESRRLFTHSTATYSDVTGAGTTEAAVTDKHGCKLEEETATRRIVHSERMPARHRPASGTSWEAHQGERGLRVVSVDQDKIRVALGSCEYAFSFDKSEADWLAGLLRDWVDGNLVLRRNVDCPACEKRGDLADDGRSRNRDCDTCGGYGMVDYLDTYEVVSKVRMDDQPRRATGF